MCGRYYIPEDDAAAELQLIIDQINRKMPAGTLLKRGEVCPTDIAPVLANNRSMNIKPFAMKWGYTLSNGKLLINTRSETASQKPLFQDGITQRRCLVPAANYYEWEKREWGKIKYAIKPASSDVMYMAGIYRLENGNPVFSILTRDPADSIAFIHNRMPVMLHKDILADWLNPRYKADEVLHTAVQDLSFTPVGA